MIPKKDLKKALSLICVLCMMFSLLCIEAIDFSAAASELQKSETESTDKNVSEVQEEPEAVTETEDTDESAIDHPSGVEDEAEPSDIKDENKDEDVSSDKKGKRAATRRGDQSSAFHATITTNNDTYESGTTAMVSVKYSLEPGIITPGDYVIMTIPESIASSASFSLNSQHFSGYEYMGGGQYKLIFGEGAETGLSGSFSAFVVTNAETTTTDTITLGDASKDITVVPGGSPGGPGVYTDTIMKDAFDNPGVSYGGYDYSDGYGDHAAQIGLADLTDGGTFKYRLYVNNKEAHLSNVTVIDQLPDGMTFNSEKGFQVINASTGTPINPSLYSIQVRGQRITFSYPGEFSNRIQINYWVDIPPGSNQGKFTNTATVTYTQDGNVYQEHRNYVLQGTANSASNGEKSVDKTEISTDPADQFVTYTVKFWNSNGFDVGEINLIDELDPHVRFVSASDNEYFSIVQDSDDPQKIRITNTSAISESMTVYVRFIVDMTDVPEGYTVENTVGGNTTKTTKDVSLKLHSIKTVDGEEPGDLRFDFELCDEDGTVIQTKQNNAEGSIVFDSLDYGADDIGTHIYRIREKESPDSSYAQDMSVYTVTVTVSRTETGSLKTDVTYAKDGDSVDPENVIFNNTSQTTSVSGTKTWSGDNESVRPNSIVVYLLADGEIVDSQTVTAATDWTYNFTGLQKYNDGIEIQYSVMEELIFGYQPEINGYDITNHFNLVPTYGLKIIKTDADDNSILLPNAEFTIYSDEACTEPAELYDNEECSGEPKNVFKTNEQGVIECFGLNANQTYYLKETSAPAAYLSVSDKLITLSLDDQGNAVLVNTDENFAVISNNGSTITEMNVRNKKLYTLPDAGGMGTYLFYLIGGFLITLALLLLMGAKNTFLKGHGKKKMLTMILLTVCLASQSVYASGNNDIVPEIDSSKPLTLTIEYKHNGNSPMSGAVFELCKVAELRVQENNAIYFFTEEFSSEGSFPEKLSAKESNSLAKKLYKKIKSAGIKTVNSTVNDEGRTVFSGLTPGMYLIYQSSDYIRSNRIYISDPFLVSVPQANVSSTSTVTDFWQYEVKAYPKSVKSLSSADKKSSVKKKSKNGDLVQQRNTRNYKTGDLFSFLTAGLAMILAAVVLIAIILTRKKRGGF